MQTYRLAFSILVICSLLVASSHPQSHAFHIEDYLMLQQVTITTHTGKAGSVRLFCTCVNGFVSDVIIV